MLRIAASGCVGVSIVSENVTVQFPPGAPPSPASEGICGRLRRIRIAWPVSSGSWLTSDTIEPPWLRIGSISIGFTESNTSHTVSARRNNAAGVAVSKENFKRRPSLSRVATTEAELSLTFVSGGSSGAATTIFGRTSTTGADVSLDGSAGSGVSGAGDIFGAVSGLISMLACSAIVSDVGGTIPPTFHNGDVSLAGLSGAAGTAAAGTAGGAAVDTLAADGGAAGAGACEASAAGDGSIDGLSVGWKPTAIM